LDKVKINLFGDSWSVKELEIDERVRSQINSIAYRLRREVSDLLLDLNLYDELRIPEIKSIEDFEGVRIRGLLNTPNSQLEIWINGKKILKIKLYDLYHQNTLFKLYETHETLIDFEGLAEGVYLFENEKGLVATYHLSSPRFSLNKLGFSLLRFIIDGNEYEILSDIFWENQLLYSKNMDVVLTSSHCRLKKDQ